MFRLLLACADGDGDTALSEPAVLSGVCPDSLDRVGAITITEASTGQTVSGGITDKPSRPWQVLGEPPCTQWYPRMPDGEGCPENEFNLSGLGCESMPVLRTDFGLRIVADGLARRLSVDSTVEAMTYQGVSEFSIEVQLPEGTYKSPTMPWPEEIEMQAQNAGSREEPGMLDIS